MEIVKLKGVQLTVDSMELNLPESEWLTFLPVVVVLWIVLKNGGAKKIEKWIRQKWLIFIK